MFSCSELKLEFSLAVINSVVAITLKTINDARAEILGRTPLKWKWLTIVSEDLKKTFNLQYDKVLLIELCKRFLISYDLSIIIFKSAFKIASHFHFKDVLSKELCSGIVYSFKCNSYNAICYGKTILHFWVRAVGHTGISYLTNKCLKSTKQS